MVGTQSSLVPIAPWQDAYWSHDPVLQLLARRPTGADSILAGRLSTSPTGPTALMVTRRILRTIDRHCDIYVE